MKTQIDLDQCKGLQLTNYIYSIDDTMLIQIFDDYFTVISLTPNTEDDPDAALILCNDKQFICDHFYEEDLIELAIYNQEELDKEHEKKAKNYRDLQYAQYLTLKKIFEPN